MTHNATQNVGQPTYKGDGNVHVNNTCTPDVHTDGLMPDVRTNGLQNGVGNVHGTYIGTRDYTERAYEEPRFKMKASERQVGGRHYTKLGIQPGQYAMANSLNYYQSLCLRYMTRYRDKNGKQDLLKAIHCIELLIEAEYGD